MSDSQLREVLLRREKFQRDLVTQFEEVREDEKQETAKKMLKEGLAVNLISRITGLSTSSIKKL
jgi:uncharacterized protein YerC